jgi:chromosome segregation ATPase
MAIETEVGVLKSVVSKLDTSIEKITQVSGDISKILAVHEQRLDGLDKVSDQRADEIKELHSRITTGNREIMDKISDMESRLDQKLQAGAKAAKEQHEVIQKEIQVDIKAIADRVDVLERWRWMIVGGAIVLGFVVGNTGIITKIFG